MKCFYHQQKDAVAICKSCNRGICESCAIEVAPGMACLNKCESDVASLNMLLERGKTAYQKTGTAYKTNAIAMLILAMLFIVSGVLPIVLKNNYGASFLIPVGLVFILWAFFSYRSGKQIEAVDVVVARGSIALEK